ncbi:MAG: hypothetical protein K8J31_27435, partial [Anaerolineae bacterium]|nr:hypothetical protein [Anaerolineae bacterium]
TGDLIARHYPILPLICLPYRASLPHLLGAGLKQAGGKIIAITEAHCVFPPDWATRVIAAHTAITTPVIGGAVEPGKGLSRSAWALYFADYGQFMQPLQPGPAVEMPGENVSFKADVLAGHDFAASGFWKTFFCQSVEQSGHPLIAEPSIVIYYNRQLTGTQIVRRRWQHGRCFGGMRERTPIKRLLFGLSGLSLPALLTYRFFRKVWPKARYRREFLLALPTALLAILSWSIGEWWGNLSGTGNSCNYV